MSPTPLLLVCLSIATALGVMTGVCAWHLYLTRRHERNRSLMALSRDQRQRIAWLESEVSSLEERHMNLQTDQAGSRADRRQMLDKVPVLNRRVADD